MNFNFKNTSQNNKRIRLIPKNGASISANIGVDNPTASIDENGVFSVCLSPSTTPIGCAGATPTADTGGIWGTSVLMLVNGIGYDGIRSIPDILEFDNQSLETHWKFKNISDDFLKVQINTGAENISEGDGGWAENTNPTLEVNFETGQVNFCLSPAGACEPTEFTMIENDSFVGGSVRLDYVVNAPDHGVENVSKRFSMTDIQQGTYLSEIVRQVISQIKEDYPFIAIREGTGTQTANFDFWTYRSTVNGSFLLAGVEGVLSKDPITIKFVKTGFIDDLFALIFPDGLTEYSAHSCGSQELVGI